MSGMKASVTLTLEDKLYSGLQRLQKSMTALKEEGRQLNLGKLQDAGNMLRGLERDFRAVTSEARSLVGVADRAFAAMKRMGQVPMQHLRAGFNAIGPQSQFGKNVGIIGGVAAGYSVMKPMEAFADYQTTLKQASLINHKYGPANDIESERLDRLFRKDALETGLPSQSIAEAYKEIASGGVPTSILDEAIGAHSRFARAYGLDPKVPGQLSIALLNNAKLNPDQYETALGQVGQISKQGLFKPAAYSLYMPEITAQMATMGMKGPDAALKAIAGLQIIRGSTADDSTAATDFKQLLEHIYAPVQERAMRLHGRMVPEDLKQMALADAGAWKKGFGIDYAGYMRDSEKRGIDPLTGFLDLMTKLTKAPDFTDKMRLFGWLNHGEQAGIASQAFLNKRAEYDTMLTEGAASGKQTFGRDYNEMMRGPGATLGRLSEEGAQAERRGGEGFAPIIRGLEGGLRLALEGMNKLDEAGFKPATDAVLGFTGAILMGTAALGVAGFAAPAVQAGWGLLAGGVTAAAPFAPLAPVLGLPVLTDLFAPPDVKLDLIHRMTVSPTDMDQSGFGPGSPPLDLSPPKEQSLQPSAPGVLERTLDQIRHRFEASTHTTTPLFGADIMPPLHIELLSDQRGAAPPPPPPDQHLIVDVNVHADANTSATATVTQSTDGMSARVRAPDPGPATLQP